MRDRDAFLYYISRLEQLLGSGVEDRIETTLGNVNSSLFNIQGAKYQKERYEGYKRVFYKLAFGVRKLEKFKRMDRPEFKDFCELYGSVIDAGTHDYFAESLRFDSEQERNGILITLQSNIAGVDMDIDMFRSMRKVIDPKDSYLLKFVDDPRPLDQNYRLRQGVWVKRS